MFYYRVCLTPQVIIAVSKLLDTSTALNCKRFQESLSVINCFATGDKAMKGTGMFWHFFNVIINFTAHYIVICSLSIQYYYDWLLSMQIRDSDAQNGINNTLLVTCTKLCECRFHHHHHQSPFWHHYFLSTFVADCTRIGIAIYQMLLKRNFNIHLDSRCV